MSKGEAAMNGERAMAECVMAGVLFERGELPMSGLPHILAMYGEYCGADFVEPRFYRYDSPLPVDDETLKAAIQYASEHPEVCRDVSF